MKQLNLKHIWTIAKYHMRFSLRNGSGIVFLLLAIITSLIVASAFISPAEAIVEATNANLQDSGLDASKVIQEIGESNEAEGAINWLLDEKDQGKYLLQEKPALLSCIMLIMLMLLPYLVCFGSFNQTSGDIANRGLRFLLLRTERPNIYIGRLLGTILFCLSTVIITVFLLVLYIQLKLDIYQGLSLWIWSFQGVLAFFLVCLPIIALCAWISSCIDSPFGSLALCLLAVAFPGIFFYFAGSALGIDSLDKLWPTGWKFGMLNSHLGTVSLTALVLLAFTALFLWIGMSKFQKRDL
jgi:ABC-type Na+ efflux pump permease subunit